GAFFWSLIVPSPNEVYRHVCQASWRIRQSSRRLVLPPRDLRAPSSLLSPAPHPGFHNRRSAMSTQGKIAAITGASSGIGEATARELAKRGAAVIVGARRIDRLEKLVAELRAQGATAEFVALDVTSRDSVQDFVRFAAERFGKLDVIVNNAGIMPLS